jgi:hypothetical protein
MNCWIGSLRGVAANFHRRGRKPRIDEPAKKRMLNSTLEDSAGHVRFHHAVGCHQIRENLIVLAVSIAERRGEEPSAREDHRQPFGVQDDVSPAPPPGQVVLGP